ncbi:MAG TPA: M13 family metallopeptidase N-terminal domain-containing protein, partial [Xanthomonadaceae bacterium]|nr:M13 family metallopeptidase N-terminal domain-containing protein [Xanthomonadaceae bacterium]
MSSRILAVWCAVALLAGAAHATDTASAKPQYGSWGFDMAGVDKATHPGDDFFRYANGTWIDKTEIPSDKPAYSLRLAMTDTVEQRLHDMLEDAAAHPGNDPSTIAAKAGAFYRSFMDEERIESIGVRALEEQLNAVRSVDRHDDLAGLMGRANYDFESSLFNIGIDVDLKDPKHYAVYISQGGLGLPDRDYYLKPEFAAQKAAYQAYLAKLLTLVGWSDPDTAAKNVVAFETRIAAASWSMVEQRNPIATYNPMSVDDLQRFAPQFAWSGFLKGAKLGNVQRIVVGEKSAFPKIAAIYNAEPIGTMLAWQAAHIADNAAFYLPKQFQDAYFDMHNKTLSGQQTQAVRWKRGVL